jgi:ribonucleoside-diphosphate reductase alpha chain
MDGPDFGKTINTAIRALTTVSDMSDLDCAPSIQRGNAESHAVGLGAMNLHGYFGREGIDYDSEEARDFTNMYFYMVNYYSLVASNKIAKERGETFVGFEKSTYATGEYFDKYIEQEWKPRTKKVARLLKHHHIPTPDDWRRLAPSVKKHGLYNGYRLAVAPTGSISYVNYATASIHPITAKIEPRKDGSIGMIYYPAAYMTNENHHLYRDAYEIGWKPLIDLYAEAQQHVDQGISLTLYFTEEQEGGELYLAQRYAWEKGIKTLYYNRLRSMVIEGTDMEGCVSCAV